MVLDSLTETDSDQNNERDSSKQTEKRLVERDVLRRVKLYFLNDEGKWDDKGTGHVSCEMVKTKDEMCLLMISESDNQKLLESKISQDDIYQLQGDSLIVWSDLETQIDMALSFQESEGCQQVWDEIRIIQGREPDSKQIVANNLEEGKEGQDSHEDDSYEPIPAADLPDPEIGNLQRIYKMMQECNSISLAKAVLDQEFLDKYFKVFEKCEDVNDLDSLRILFQIFKLIICLDEVVVLNQLFKKDNMLKLFGVLEYDPSLPVNRANHRDYLRRVVVFKEVIPFSDRSIVDKIHQSFQIQYLKDTVLPRALDDGTGATLSQMIQTNNNAILISIRDDETFMTKLFDVINSTETTAQQLRDGIKFLQEYNNMTKSVTHSMKSDIYLKLSKIGIFAVIETKLRNKDEVVRHICAEILFSILANNSSLVREYIVEQKTTGTTGSYMLESIVHGIVDEPELGIQDTLTEVLKVLLDPDSLLEDKDTILDIFYNTPIDLLVTPLINPASFSTSAKIHTLDVLQHIVQHHGYWSRNYIIKHEIMSKALDLLKSAVQKDLILSVIRFFRTCVTLCDIFYNNNILRHNLFEPIMKVWRANVDKYNLINSSIINLFEFISKENMKRLISHLVTNYRADMEKVEYVETFRQLISQHARNEEDQSSRDPGHLISDQDKEEQDDASYFDESDSEETKQSPEIQDAPRIDDSSNKAEDEDFFKSLVPAKKDEEEDDFLSHMSDNDSASPKPQQIKIHLDISPDRQNGSNSSSTTSSGKKRSQSDMFETTPDSGDMMLDDSPQKKRKLSPERILVTHLDENKHLS